MMSLEEENIEASGLSADEQIELLLGAAIEDRDPSAALKLVYKFGRAVETPDLVRALRSVEAGSAEAGEILEEISRGDAAWLKRPVNR